MSYLREGMVVKSIEFPVENCAIYFSDDGVYSNARITKEDGGLGPLTCVAYEFKEDTVIVPLSQIRSAVILND